MKLYSVTLLAALSIACSSKPEAKAPGTDPEDMSAAEHRAEAEEHDQEADEHRGMDGQKPGGGEKAQHLREAQEHRDIADQHEEAADEAESE